MEAFTSQDVRPCFRSGGVHRTAQDPEASRLNPTMLQSGDWERIITWPVLSARVLTCFSTCFYSSPSTCLWFDMRIFGLIWLDHFYVFKDSEVHISGIL